MASQGGNNTSGSGAAAAAREYRKGNWTVSETMVLIEAKKMDDERRSMRRITTASSNDPSTSEAIRLIKPAELRWKWVEDYCWNKGCYRNQNQCNDKWDNLMRDYKKVREYERRLAEEEGAESNANVKSYWKLEKNERKERNLPSNMLLQIYQALADVVERKVGGYHHHHHHHHQRITTSTTTTSIDNTMVGYNVEMPMMVTSVVPLLQPHQVSSPSHHVLLPLPPPPLQPPQQSLPPPPPPPLLQSPQPPLALPLQTMSDSSDTDTSHEYSDSPAKRRRKGGGGEGTSGGGGSSTSYEVGSAIAKSTSKIIEAIQASEEREERRHKELLDLHERRLRIEESKSEISRQGIYGLVDAINNLASSILALASHKNQSSSTHPK